MNLLLSSDQALSSVPLLLAFDPLVFQLLEVVEGDWLRQGGATATFGTEVTTAGQLRLAPAQVRGEGAKGQGVVATMHFKVVSDAPTGETRILLQSMSPLGPGGRALPFTLPPALAVTIAE